jgi:hypothetical protein
VDSAKAALDCKTLPADRQLLRPQAPAARDRFPHRDSGSVSSLRVCQANRAPTSETLALSDIDTLSHAKYKSSAFQECFVRAMHCRQTLLPALPRTDIRGLSPPRDIAIGPSSRRFNSNRKIQINLSWSINRP